MYLFLYLCSINRKHFLSIHPRTIVVGCTPVPTSVHIFPWEWRNKPSLVCTQWVRCVAQGRVCVHTPHYISGYLNIGRREMLECARTNHILCAHTMVVVLDGVGFVSTLYTISRDISLPLSVSVCIYIVVSGEVVWVSREVAWMSGEVAWVSREVAWVLCPDQVLSIIGVRRTAPSSQPASIIIRTRREKCWELERALDWMYFGARTNHILCLDGVGFVSAHSAEHSSSCVVSNHRVWEHNTETLRHWEERRVQGAEERLRDKREVAW